MADGYLLSYEGKCQNLSGKVKIDKWGTVFHLAPLLSEVVQNRTVIDEVGFAFRCTKIE